MRQPPHTTAAGNHFRNDFGNDSRNHFQPRHHTLPLFPGCAIVREALNSRRREGAKRDTAVRAAPMAGPVGRPSARSASDAVRPEERTRDEGEGDRRRERSESRSGDRRRVGHADHKPVSDERSAGVNAALCQRPLCPFPFLPQFGALAENRGHFCCWISGNG
jgi:hypothetical protein